MKRESCLGAMLKMGFSFLFAGCMQGTIQGIFVFDKI